MGKTHARLIVSLEPWCTTDELGELWSVEGELIEEGYRQGLESWGIDLGKEVLRVLADPLECQIGDGGEESACERRWMSASPDRT
jgi:hypothetical protein